jgi:hypothetical protein
MKTIPKIDPETKQPVMDTKTGLPIHNIIAGPTRTLDVDIIDTTKLPLKIQESLKKQVKLLLVGVAAGHMFEQALRNVIITAREGSDSLGQAAMDKTIEDLTEATKIQKEETLAKKAKRDVSHVPTGINQMGDMLEEQLHNIAISEKAEPTETELSTVAQKLHTETLLEVSYAHKFLLEKQNQIIEAAKKQIENDLADPKNKLTVDELKEKWINSIENTFQKLVNEDTKAGSITMDHFPCWETPKRGEAAPQTRTNNNGKVLTSYIASQSPNRFQDAILMQALDTYFILKFPKSNQHDAEQRVKLIFADAIYGKETQMTIKNKRIKLPESKKVEMTEAKAKIQDQLKKTQVKKTR